MATVKGTGRSVSSTAKIAKPATKPAKPTARKSSAKATKAPATKAAVKKPAAKKPAAKMPPVAKAAAKKGSSLPVAVAGLDDVPALVRQLAGELHDPRQTEGPTLVAAVALALAALDRSDLASELLDLLPADRRVVERLPVEAAAGHDIEALWKPWLAAIEKKNSFGKGIDVEALARDLRRAIDAARGPAREQLIAHARTRLESVMPGHDEAHLVALLVHVGDLAGAQQLVDRPASQRRRSFHEKRGPVARLATALFDRGQHEAALTLLERLTPDAVNEVLHESDVFRAPLARDVRERLGRILDALPAKSAEEARDRLATADTLARLVAGEDIAPSSSDRMYLEALLRLGLLDAARRFLAHQPAPARFADGWMLARFRLGLDDLATLESALDLAKDWLARLRGLLGAMRVMLERDPRDPRIDQVWALVEAMLRDIPPSDHDADFVGRVQVDALLVRADVDLARGLDIVPLLERVCSPALLESASGEAKEIIIARWQQIGRPDEAEATVERFFPFLRTRYLPLVAAGFLPDLGRSVASLRRLGDSHAAGQLRSLAALLEGMKR